MEQLKSDFEALYLNKDNKEQVFQTFLEEHPNLIPRSFEQNHGVHLDLALRKTSFGTDYKSDFMFLTKSSTNWYAVHVEIEDPNKAIFNKNDMFNANFNGAIQQIESWLGWLSKVQNLSFFENYIKQIKQPLGSNPIEHKYVLVYGRRSELNTERRKEAFNSKKRPNIDLMTYDSLFEKDKGNLHIGSLSQGKVKIHCDCDIDDKYFNFVNPAEFVINEKIKEDKISKLSIPVTGTHQVLLNQNRLELLSKWQQVDTFKA